MNKLRTWVQSELFKNKIYPEIERVIAVIVFTITYRNKISKEHIWKFQT